MYMFTEYCTVYNECYAQCSGGNTSIVPLFLMRFFVQRMLMLSLLLKGEMSHDCQTYVFKNSTWASCEQCETVQTNIWGFFLDIRLLS